MSLTIRPAVAADYPALLTMNEAAVPAVNSISTETLAALHSQAVALLVAEGENQQLAGMLLCLDQDTSYDSLNFRWFAAREAQFAYIDRVVVAEQARGAGVGAALYRHLLPLLSQPALTCEVNLEPPNPGSLRFHQRLGFEAVGEQATEGGAKRVCLMRKALA